MDKQTVVLRTSNKTNPNKLAGSAVKNMQENKNVEIVAVGAGAVNQTVKALAIGRTFVAGTGKDLVFTVGFMDVMIEEQKKTAMKFILIVK